MDLTTAPPASASSSAIAPPKFTTAFDAALTRVTTLSAILSAKHAAVRSAAVHRSGRDGGAPYHASGSSTIQAAERGDAVSLSSFRRDAAELARRQAR
jgi:hypothetical protein